MGYTTEFRGQFQVVNLETGKQQALTLAQYAYLKAFAQTRRMDRHPFKADTLDDPKRKAVGLPIGDSGGYFVGNEENHGQGHDKSVRDGNKPPVGQPGLWCQWTPTEDGTAIEWDEGEKFYDYVAWIEYILENFLKPWGLGLAGSVEWEGEEFGDRGSISADKEDITVSANDN